MTTRALNKASLATFLALIAGLNAAGVYATQESTPLDSSWHQSSALRKEQGNLKIQMKLIADTAPDPNSLHTPAIKGDTGTAIKLLDTNSGRAQLNQRKATDFQRTPLHRLAKSPEKHFFLSFTAVAQLLLNYGADITTRDLDGKTPLDHALGNHQKAVLERLNRERMQALRAFSEKLQEKLPVDVVRHLITLAPLTEEQRQRLMHLDQE